MRCIAQRPTFRSKTFLGPKAVMPRTDFLDRARVREVFHDLVEVSAPSMGEVERLGDLPQGKRLAVGREVFKHLVLGQALGMGVSGHVSRLRPFYKIQSGLLWDHDPLWKTARFTNKRQLYLPLWVQMM